MTTPKQHKELGWVMGAGSVCHVCGKDYLHTHTHQEVVDAVTHPAPASASEPYPDHNVKRPTAEPVVLSMKRSERESLSPEAFMALQHGAEKMAQIAKADDDYKRSQGAGRERLANTVLASASVAGASEALQAMADNERELGLGYETGASAHGPLVPVQDNDPGRHRQIGICDEGHAQFWEWIRKAYRDAESLNACFSLWNMQVSYKAGWLAALSKPAVREENQHRD